MTFGRLFRFTLLVLAPMILLSSTALQVAADDDEDGAEPNSLIAFSSDRGGGQDIWIVDPENPSNLTQLTFAPQGQSDDGPVWSPDGSRLAFARFRSDGKVSLWVINADKTGEEQILAWTPKGGGSIIPHFWYRGDPNGERVYYIQDPGGSCSFLWIYADLPPTQSPNVVNGAANKCQPDISPDQTRVVLRDYGQNVDIEVGDLSPNGTLVTGITDIVSKTLGSELILPEWSPDGTRIAFSVEGKGIWSVAPDGSDLQQITGIAGFTPTWSPDSSRIAFHAKGGTGFDILVLSSDGIGPAVNLTNDGALDINPSWSPTLDDDGDDDIDDDDGENDTEYDGD